MKECTWDQRRLRLEDPFPTQGLFMSYSLSLYPNYLGQRYGAQTQPAQRTVRAPNRRFLIGSTITADQLGHPKGYYSLCLNNHLLYSKKPNDQCGIIALFVVPFWSVPSMLIYNLMKNHPFLFHRNKFFLKSFSVVCNLLKDPRFHDLWLCFRGLRVWFNHSL